jgi:hypothetical protein
MALCLTQTTRLYAAFMIIPPSPKKEGKDELSMKNQILCISRTIIRFGTLRDFVPLATVQYEHYMAFSYCFCTFLLYSHY